MIDELNEPTVVSAINKQHNFVNLPFLLLYLDPLSLWERDKSYVISYRNILETNNKVESLEPGTSS